MSRLWVKNADRLGLTEDRKMVLGLIETAYNSIDTEQIIRSQVLLSGEILKIKNQEFDLTKFKRVFIIGFGKVSCKAALVLESILGNRITDGVAIGLAALDTKIVRTYKGSHPKPTVENFKAAQEIVNISEKLTEDDLVITVVSGGGSALLCWPMSECEISQRLYEGFLKTGGNIKELNTIRKHISKLKGGGLAEKLYPANVLGLIFSDIPGNDYSLIASGPTYQDVSTIDDAMQIIKKYGLEKFELNETIRDDKFFEKVTNIPLVSNEAALLAMVKQAQELGLTASILTNELYDSPKIAVQRLIDASSSHQLVVAGGEPSLIVTKSGGTGGRDARMGMRMLEKITPGMTFAAVASDGLDNGPYAGIIEDHETLDRVKKLNLDAKFYLDNYDSNTFYSKLGAELLETGATEANVSDLFILFKK